MIRKAAIAIAISAMSLTFAQDADAQQVKNGGPKGTIVSGFAKATGGGLPVVVFTADSSLIVEAAYSVSWTGSTLITMSDVGRSGGSNSDNPPVCMTYEPGLIVPKDEVISCQETSGGSTVACTVSGCSMKKWRPTSCRVAV